MKFFNFKEIGPGNVFRYLRTLKYLKGSQIFYRLFYEVRDKWRKWTSFSPALPAYTNSTKLEVTFTFLSENSYPGENTFLFLNQTKKFSSDINWNFMGYGKLWNYNLLYFDYLNQPEVTEDWKLASIQDFVDKFSQIKFARDPYPLSLRCINWIKFLMNNNVEDRLIDYALYKQHYLLLDNLEYHLMGNHLLENGCSLLIGGVYFDDSILLKNGREILNKQLDEQILKDGGHFERSPMYHQLLLYRLMDCYNIMVATRRKENMLQEFLKITIEHMLGWLKEMTFKAGCIPRVNDTANNIAPSTKQLSQYACQLGLKEKELSLGESGYRMIKNAGFEWLVDVGDIGPDYIPGHAHSDTFSFILNVSNKPVIVDTGTSTYEECERRTVERSTASHNTVMINGKEQTEVWKSFRVGRRAHISKLEEGPGYISAEHDGYKHLGLRHRRTFEWHSTELLIKDVVFGKKDNQCTAFFHFHPRVNIEQKNKIIFADDLTLSFSGQNNIQIKPYWYATGFNLLEPASVIEVKFRDKLETRIRL